MESAMKRGRSQVIWRYTPGAIFRYNDAGAWCKTVAVTVRDPQPLTGALADAVAHSLRAWNAIGQIGFPDPTSQPSKYVVGEPYQVNFTVWPTVFICRNCGRVHFYRDVERLRQVNDRVGCSSCRGKECLRQVPYGYVCECGRLDSVYIPRHEANHFIALVNRGSFRESFWMCRDCQIPLLPDPRAGLGFRPCECVPRKAKRGTLLEDTGVYYSQTTAVVDIQPAILEQWQQNPHFSDFLIAGTLNLPAYRSTHLLDLARAAGGSDELSSELTAVRDLLIQGGKSPDEAESFVRQSARMAGGDPWASYTTQLAPLRPSIGYPWREHRQTIEYVFVRDEPSITAIPLTQLIAEAVSRGDLAASARLAEDKNLADELGLVDLRVVLALPNLLAGFGYSRVFASPQDSGGSQDGRKPTSATLRPYEPQDGRIPIYVARNTTEALLYRLDAWRLAAFLELNSDRRLPKLTDGEPAVRAWLLSQSGVLLSRGESHLTVLPFEAEAGLTVDESSALLFGVLHTLSHVLKATAHLYVGLDSDSVAEYLFTAHGAGLLYISKHVDFTLGGIDSAFRANLTQWLASARDYADRCSFDPVCSRSGGACLACLYPKFGCAYFNRTVSRSFLFGGFVQGRSDDITGFWSPAVKKRADELRAGQ